MRASYRKLFPLLGIFAIFVCLCPRPAASNSKKSDDEDGADALLGVLDDLERKPTYSHPEPASDLLDLIQLAPQYYSFDIVGGLRTMECQQLIEAEENKETHMRLLLAVSKPARSHARPHLSRRW
jgi:hypothetical protein